MSHSDLSTNTQELLTCIIRRKSVPATPEEHVRQHLLRHFIQELKYPAGLMQVEVEVPYNTMSKRADIIVRDRDGGVWLLVECKRPKIKLQQQVISQLAMYNKVLDAQYLMVSNGAENHVFHMDEKTKSLQALATMPSYPEL